MCRSRLAFPLLAPSGPQISGGMESSGQERSLDFVQELGISNVCLGRNGTGKRIAQSWCAGKGLPSDTKLLLTKNYFEIIIFENLRISRVISGKSLSFPGDFEGANSLENYEK